MSFQISSKAKLLLSKSAISRLSDYMAENAGNQERAEKLINMESISFKDMRHAVRSFSGWYFEKHTPEELEGFRKNNLWGSEAAQARTPFETLAGDLPYLWDRFEKMEDYEKETLNDLRDRDVSIPDLIDYIRAEPGFNPENKPIRVDVASNLRKKAFLKKSKRIESTGRSSALVAGAVVLVGVAAMAVAGPAAGPIAAWIPKAWAIATSVVKAAAGGSLMLIAWKSWNEINNLKNSIPTLNIGADKDFEDLPRSFANMPYTSLNEEYESIPRADKHLIKHLSPTELRMFLVGHDKTRLHILRSSPPPSWAKVQSRLDPIVRKEGGVIKKSTVLLWTMISSPWHREKNNARVPDLKDRMKDWRAFSDTNKKYADPSTAKLVISSPKKP